MFKTRILFVFAIVLAFALLAGCSPTFNPDQVASLSTSMVSACAAQSAIELPAPDGGSYKIPIPNPSRDANCAAGQRYVYEMTRSGWERFGTNVVTQAFTYAGAATPYAALTVTAVQGLRHAGDRYTDSYNQDNSNQGNPVTTSTDNSNQGNPVTTTTTDNSNQGNPVSTDNSNQGNPVDNSVTNPAPDPAPAPVTP